MNRMLRLLPLATVALLTCQALPAQAVDVPVDGLYGRLKNDTYIAPEGIYRVRVPVLPELGGEITDTENVVNFQDKISTHISIACFRLDMSQRWDLSELGRREYLSRFYVNHVLKDFQTRFPGTTAETTMFTAELQQGALMGYALLPGGSSFAEPLAIPGAPPGPAPVAKRGNLLFVREDRIFIISIELAERVTQGKLFQKTAEEENVLLRDRLIQFTNRLRFPAPPAPAKLSRQP